jgi:hypothetical protein
MVPGAVKTRVVQKWSALLPGRHYVSSDEQTRACWADIDGDGELELCLQLGNDLMEVKGHQVVAVFEDRRVAAVAGLDDGSWVEVSGGAVRLQRGGEVQWERRLPGARLGFGFGRDWDDELDAGSRFVGRYDEELRVRALELVDVDGDGEVEVVVFTSRGRLLAFGLDGEPRWARYLERGSFDATFVVPLEGNGEGPSGRLVLSSMLRYGRKLSLWQKYEHEWVSFLLHRGRVEGRTFKVGAVLPVPGQPRQLVGVSGEVLALNGTTLAARPTVNGGGRKGFSLPRYASGQLFVRDGLDPLRGLVLSLDIGRGTVTAAVPGGSALWECALGPAQDRVELVSGVLGTAGSPADGMVGLQYRVTRVLPEYRTEVREHRLRVFDRDGSTLGEHVFPYNEGSLDSARCVLLADPDEDGVAELLLLGAEALTAFAVDLGRNGDDRVGVDGGWSDLPEVPLPPEDLWAVDLVGLQGEGV